jgi:hypothetical protein
MAQEAAAGSAQTISTERPDQAVDINGDWKFSLDDCSARMKISGVRPNYTGAAEFTCLKATGWPKVVTEIFDVTYSGNDIQLVGEYVTGGGWCPDSIRVRVINRDLLAGSSSDRCNHPSDHVELTR